MVLLVCECDTFLELSWSVGWYAIIGVYYSVRYGYCSNLVHVCPDFTLTCFAIQLLVL